MTIKKEKSYCVTVWFSYKHGSTENHNEFGKWYHRRVKDFKCNYSFQRKQCRSRILLYVYFLCFMNKARIGQISIIVFSFPVTIRNIFILEIPKENVHLHYTHIMHCVPTSYQYLVNERKQVLRNTIRDQLGC